MRLGEKERCNDLETLFCAASSSGTRYEAEKFAPMNKMMASIHRGPSSIKVHVMPRYAAGTVWCTAVRAASTRDLMPLNMPLSM